MCTIPRFLFKSKQMSDIEHVLYKMSKCQIFPMSNLFY